MPPKIDEPVIPRHVNLYASDWEFYTALAERARMKPNTLIRSILRKWRRDYEERIVRKQEGERGSGEGWVPPTEEGIDL